MADKTTQEYAFFLGRQTEIAASEIWVMLQKQGFQPKLVSFIESTLIISTSQEIQDWAWFNRLGGVERAGKVLRRFREQITSEDIGIAISPIAKKMHFGLSTIGVPYPGRKFLLSIKKYAKEEGCRLNFVEPKVNTSRLSSAQVLFNGLYRPPHAEITLIKDKEALLLVRTYWVQDIEAYEKRDTARPARDAYVGMLPPKLAQTMISLATSKLPLDTSATILDPFCGLGTIVQEGWLAGYKMVGSDKEKRMIESSHTNLNWVQKLYNLSNDNYPKLFVHDATQPFPEHLRGQVDIIVTEPFLGTPLLKTLPRIEAEDFLQNLYPLYREFFRQSLTVLKDHGVLLTILPAISLSGASERWLYMKDTFLDDLAAIGYLKHQLVPQELHSLFPPSQRKSLFYARPDAVIGRELALWRKV